MEPYDKARHLFNKMYTCSKKESAKDIKSILHIAVTEMIDELEAMNEVIGDRVKDYYNMQNYIQYWKDVRNEIDWI